MRSPIISTTANAISSGGTISGDVTISGDLTVTGSGGAVYDEIIEGSLHIKTGSAGTISTLAYADDLVIEQTGEGVGLSLRFDDDRSGSIVWQSTTSDNIARIYAAYSSGNEVLAFETVGTERLVIDDDGKVGIGTGANIDELLHVQNDSNNAVIKIEAGSSGNGARLQLISATNDTGDINFGDSGDTNIGRITYNHTSNYLAIHTNDTERFRIDSSGHSTFKGNIIIDESAGTSNSAILMLKADRGSDGQDSSEIQFWNDGVTAIAEIVVERGSSDTAGDILINTSNAERVRIDETGDVGIGRTPQVNHASYTSLEIGGDGTIMSHSTAGGGATYYGNGFYYDGTFKYISASSAVSGAANINMQDAEMGFQIAVTPGSHSAGDAISFSTRFKIDDNSRISLSNNDSGTSSTVFGYGAGVPGSSAALGNVFVGHQAGENVGSNDTDGNVMIGYRAGRGTFTAATDHNIGIGYIALNVLTSGHGNVAIGSSSGALIQDGESNTAIGRNALGQVVSSNQNVSVGYNSGYGLTTGGSNTVIGGEALYNSADIDRAVVIGKNAIYAGNATAAADGTIAIGYDCMRTLTSGARNIAIGYEAGKAMTDNASNIAIGYQSFLSADSGESNNIVIGEAAGSDINHADSDDNIIIGKDAGQGGAAAMIGCVAIGKDAMNSTASNAQTGTIAIGSSALTALTSGAGNTAVGYLAGTAINTGANNTILGHSALDALTDGSQNIAIGTNAMGAATSVERCVAIGYDALTAGDTDADGTIAIGYFAGRSIIGGVGNTAIGYESMTSTSSGQHNTAVGYRAAKALVNGSDKNTAIGYIALTAANNDTSHENTAVGYGAGDAVTTGNSNTCLGSQANVSAGGAASQIVIGQAVTGTADNAVHIGNGTSHIRCDFNADQTWDASSDRRQKKDIEESQLGLDFINDLKPSKYKYKSPSEFPKEWKAYDPEDKSPMGGSDKYYYGFIAQEVKEAVDKHDASDCGVWNSDSDGRQRVSREQFVVSLIKAVQELSSKVEDLEAKIK